MWAGMGPTDRGEYTGIYDQGNGNPPGYEFSDLDPKGWGIGAHIGYNYTMGDFLLGIEADITKLNFEDDDLYVENQGANPSDPMGGTIDLLYSVRGRARCHGIESWNIYGTAGIAWANYEVTTTNTFDNLDGDQSHTDHGWVAGAGVEYALNSNWIIRAEYLHYDFDETHDLKNAFSTDVDAGDDLGLESIDQIRFWCQLQVLITLDFIISKGRSLGGLFCIRHWGMAIHLLTTTQTTATHTPQIRHFPG